MKLWLGKPTLNNLKNYRWQIKIKNLDGGLELGCICSLFIGKHCVDSELLNMGYVDKGRAEVNWNLLFTFVADKWREHLVGAFTLFILASQFRCHEFRKYSSNHILEVCRAHNQSAVKKSACSFKNMLTWRLGSSLLVYNLFLFKIIYN